MRYVLRVPYPKNRCHSQPGGRVQEEMGLSAAASARCTVWKSSVMAYLMVIVWSGESPPSCLHAGVSGARVEATAVVVEEWQWSRGRGEGGCY